MHACIILACRVRALIHHASLTGGKPPDPSRCTRLPPALPPLVTLAASQRAVQQLVDASVRRDAFLKALAGGIVKHEKAKLKQHVRRLLARLHRQ